MGRIRQKSQPESGDQTQKDKYGKYGIYSLMSGY